MEGAISASPAARGFAHATLDNAGVATVIFRTELIPTLFGSDKSNGDESSASGWEERLAEFLTPIADTTIQFVQTQPLRRSEHDIFAMGTLWQVVVECSANHMGSASFDIYVSNKSDFEYSDVRPQKSASTTETHWEHKASDEAVASALGHDILRVAYDLTENIPVGTYTMVLRPGDEIANFHFVSKRFLEITGLTREEAQSDPLRAFECVHPEDLPVWIEKNRYAFERRCHFREETRVIIDGDTRWVVAESSPRRLEDGSWLWEGVIQDITDQKLAEAALAATTQLLVEQKQSEARLQERQSLLRDMHDGLGAQLTLAAIRLRQGRISSGEAYQILRDCLADLRILMDSLDGIEQSLLYCLSGLKQRVEMSLAGGTISCTWDLDLNIKSELPPRVVLDILRIVNEAITNAIRHSGCQIINISAREAGDHIQIEISDDGKGFDPSSSFSGRGLANMKRRAKLSGISFQICSTNAGTTIQISLRCGAAQPSRLSDNREIA